MGQSQTKPQSILSYFDIYDYGGGNGIGMGKRMEHILLHLYWAGINLYKRSFWLFVLFIVRIWVEVLN